MTLTNICCWGYCSKDLRSVQYLFKTIIPKSTLTYSIRTCQVVSMDETQLFRNYSHWIGIIIIIIMSCRQHRYPWPSLATPPYRSSLLVGPLGYLPYLHRAAVYRFELVALLLLGHMRGSIGEYHLWARPSFSSSILHILFV